MSDYSVRGAAGAPLAVVTGGTAGIGAAVAARLASAGWQLVVVGRDQARGRHAVEKLTAGGARAWFEPADLSLVSDSTALAERIAARGPLRALVLNAGGHFAERRVTAEGNEATLAMNVLTPTNLVRLLREPLIAGVPSRVVFVSSDAHRFARRPLDDPQSAAGYRGFSAYARTKLLGMLVARQFAREFAGTGVDVFAVNPGTAWTEQTARLRPGMFPLPMRLNWPIMRLVQRRATPERAATAPAAAVLEESLRGIGWAWINEKGRIDRPSRLVEDDDLARSAFAHVQAMLPSPPRAAPPGAGLPDPMAPGAGALEADAGMPEANEGMPEHRFPRQ